MFNCVKNVMVILVYYMYDENGLCKIVYDNWEIEYVSVVIIDEYNGIIIRRNYCFVKILIDMFYILLWIFFFRMISLNQWIVSIGGLSLKRR